MLTFSGSTSRLRLWRGESRFGTPDLSSHMPPPYPPPIPSRLRRDRPAPTSIEVLRLPGSNDVLRLASGLPPSPSKPQRPPVELKLPPPLAKPLPLTG